MLGFAGKFLPAAVLHFVTRLMRAIGDPRRAAWKWSEKPGGMPEGRMALLTHDAQRYADELWWRENRPELAMGPASWGWLERAYASMRGLEKPGVLETVTTPIMMIATSADELVDFGAIQRAASRLPHARLLSFGKEARHEILREVDEVRDRALAALDGFLDELVRPGK
jgi:lysophospholipase